MAILEAFLSLAGLLAMASVLPALVFTVYYVANRGRALAANDRRRRARPDARRGAAVAPLAPVEAPPVELVQLVPVEPEAEAGPRRLTSH